MIVVQRLLRKLFSLVKKKIVGLNLLKNQSHDVRIQRYQVIATRLYVTILVVCLITIALYQGIRQDLRQETVQNPTLSRYLDLETMELDSLVCPCPYTNISIARQKFISIEPTFHDVCSSVFVSSSWIGYFDEVLRRHEALMFPYRLSLGSSFLLLDTLCEHAQATVKDAVRLFLQTDFLIAQILRQSIFTSQFETLIESWKSNTINRFELETTLFQAVQQGNKYLNEFYNFKYSINQSNGEINMVPVQYSNCSCEFSQQCRTPTLVGMGYQAALGAYGPFTIDDFFVGCSLLDALAQSTLQCLYNRTCLDDIRTYITPRYVPALPPPFDGPLKALKQSSLFSID